MIGKAQAGYARLEVENVLGGHAGNRCASYVLDAVGEASKMLTQGGDLLGSLLRPVLAVGDDDWPLGAHANDCGPFESARHSPVRDAPESEQAERNGPGCRWCSWHLAFEPVKVAYGVAVVFPFLV